jgi:cyclic beta-1,2-glucan synthetase
MSTASSNLFTRLRSRWPRPAPDATAELVSGPLRGELLGAEQLGERIVAVARGQRLAAVQRRRALLLARLNDSWRILQEAHARLAAAAGEEVDVGPAGDWLLDNFHVVREHIVEVHASLPRGFYHELPELEHGPLAGYPRVYELAITLISHTEARVDDENVDLVLSAFQRVTPLSIGELWAMPAMLRLALIESVRRMTLRTLQRLDEIEAADAWADRFQTASDSSRRALGATLNGFVTSPPPLTPYFVSRLLQRLRQSRGDFPPLVWLEEWIGEDGPSAEEADAWSAQRQSITQITMANSITSLRTIARVDWRPIVERQSVIEAVLRQDPSGFYSQMTFATRDRYRHVVERLAKRTGRDEASVASVAIELARRVDGNGARDARRSHVGYFLVDAGLAELERAVGYRPGLGEAVHRWVLRHPNLVFGGGILVATGALLWIVWRTAAPVSFAWAIVAMLVALIPVNDVAINLVNQLVTNFIPPRTLPKLDLSEHGSGGAGIPIELRTAVVVPTLFASVEMVDEALVTLEVHLLANRQANLHFALLSDFADAATETCPEDHAILERAVAGVRDLNARYAGTDGAGDRFYLFHRPRRWNASEGVWMGWERKRGKLAEFNQYVRGGGDGAFSVVIGDVDAIRAIRYVITLDSDTVLPPGTAALLVGVLAHPLNRARYDAKLGRVVDGYGIVQPRVGISLPSAHRSRFAAIYSGHPGVDPYTTAVSDVYQDLFGEGSFTGKGIYDIAAFETATHGRFPENALLSHDLIEGSYARAALATDINVYDDYPSGYLTFTRRKHRWIRGDWQLLRWLTRRVPGPDGPEPNRLSVLSRWKILDNLRRSVVEIAQLVFLVAGWTVLAGSPMQWTALALGAIAAPWIVSLCLAMLQPPFDKSWRAYYGTVARDASTSAEQFALALMVLPHQALVSADAILRTLWRLTATQRHLLEWRSSSQTEREGQASAGAMWRAMWPAMVLVAVISALALGAAIHADQARRLEIGGVVLPFLVLWASAPAIAFILSTPAVPLRPTLSADERNIAMRYARLHWQYFDTFVTAETNWLAPDNFQEDPAAQTAMRVSPTNIGLQFLSTVSACDLGFIDVEEMAERLELSFRTLERMPRFRGHFYNWYDLRDLRVLEPAYISTVDSGNLCGHLIAVRQACLERSKTDGDLGARLAALADRSYQLAMEMDFRFLFDRHRKLFSIGYQQSTHTLDSSYYDLLASEARLASFVAIAKDDVPVEHWFHLGRTLTRAAGESALVSWSGSMFEYLMPVLVMRSFPYTVLGETYGSAVRRQIAYGAERDVPWGVSESAYNLRDRHLTYQYHAFGVPDLALKRGLSRDLVVAPYASALALAVEPVRGLSNLTEQETLGALGQYGFYDAIDYTRPNPGERFAIVRNFMAHHIGMSMVAFTNVLAAEVWQRRFHRDPLVRAVELLLFERVPRRVVIQAPQKTRADEALPDPDLEHPTVREVGEVDTPQPHVALLGRLPYTIMVSHCGAGYSRYEDLAVTRWRADGTTDNTGQFCYVKDVRRHRVWSAAHQPVCAPAEYYQALLATDRVTFTRLDDGIETRTEIVIVPHDSAEVRRVTLSNVGTEAREIELTSYGEVVLAPPNADRSHPAFSNLFVETEWHEWCSAITATRRPRSSQERRLWCAHVVATDSPARGPATCETDRARFVGRGRSTRDPIALETDGPLSGTTGAVLDPVFALRVRVVLEAGESTSVSFTTLVATTREQVFTLADRYHHPHAAQRALDLAWTATQVELRELNITPTAAAVFQDLASQLLYANPALRVPQEELRANHGSQPLLWSQGVSGDWPILLATINSKDGLPTLRELFAAHRFWRRRGMTVDLVVLNEHGQGYTQDLNDLISAAMFTATDSAIVDRPGGVFVRRRDVMNAVDLQMLRATARIVIDCDGRSLSRLLDSTNGKSDQDAWLPEPAVSFPRSSGRHTPVAVSRVRPRTPGGSMIRVDAPVDSLGDASARSGERPLPGRAVAASAAVSGRARGNGQVHGKAASTVDSGSLRFDNGVGAVTPDGDYLVRVRGDAVPPAPWVNCIANARGGFLVSERGGGCMWAENSQFYRLTPWHNDPVSDPASDVLYLRDEDTGDSWSATPAPMRREAPYTVLHGVGSTSFAHDAHEIETHLTLGIAEDAPIKLSLLRVTNRSARTRRIAVTAFVEWVLGALREHTQHQVVTSFSAKTSAIHARNSFDPLFASRVAFCAMSEPLVSFTADRREFIGRNGGAAAPPGLARQLSGTTGAGIDPCAAMRCLLTLRPGDTLSLVVVLGAADGADAADAAVAEYCDVARAEAALARTVALWKQRLSVVTVRTPEPSFDVMLNKWCLYQALGCRMWGRTALYQSSGAFGFRDQLQDSMAFLYAEPALAREHILRAASRQFVEGDVQHWWHPESGRGVRTRFSDDLAWLPFVVDHYIRLTGDAAILDERVPFLTMRALEPHEHEVYDLPRVSDEQATLHEHCLRALRKACTTGAHGLPLMGTGDWNDGMNRVGAEGRGESVWLAWFLVATLRAFSSQATARGDASIAAELRAIADRYAVAVEAHGWDGAWYRRAYFDDGAPLGSASSDECRIDAIAQSWSVISGAGAPERQAQAMQSFEQFLVRDDARLLMLLTPPFDKTLHDPGYIKGYLPGVRENGAQYTHAALWSVLATALRGDGERAFALFQMLNPLTHALTAQDVATYKVEPYVVAADVYTAEGHLGRGGWTWYTGSASWMYRVGLEAILGLHKRGDALAIQPCVPATWPSFTILYRYGGSTYELTVEQPGAMRDEAADVEIDGRRAANGTIPLIDDGREHRVIVRPRRTAVADMAAPIST